MRYNLQFTLDEMSAVKFDGQVTSVPQELHEWHFPLKNAISDRKSSNLLFRLIP